jgi:hypothetical protein
MTKSSLAALFLAVAALSGCSVIGHSFSQTPDDKTRNDVHAAVAIGADIEEAQARLSGLDFDCSTRSGDYQDELGNSRSAERFIECVRRPGRYSFNCENRDKVVLIPNAGVVDEVNVIRGPSCSKP